MKEIRVKPIMTEKQAQKYLGVLLKDKDYEVLIDEDCDVYCEESGILLAKFRRKQIPMEMIVKSYSSFAKAATPTSNRGVSAGLTENGTMRKARFDADGNPLKWTLPKVVNSGLMGYYDRSLRNPYCRTTAYTGNNFSEFIERCQPVIKRVSDLYKELIPDRWNYQMDYVEKTSKDFIIPETCFTTITCNKNWQTAAHTDKGDLKGGFGNLVVMRKGRYVGGYFVLIKWGIAFNLQNGDVLFTDVHQVHGNTPIHTLTKGAERISLVMYYRENMIVCGSAEEELEIAKRRKDLKNLNERDYE